MEQTSTEIDWTVAPVIKVFPQAQLTLQSTKYCGCIPDFMEVILTNKPGFYNLNMMLDMERVAFSAVFSKDDSECNEGAADNKRGGDFFS